MTPELVVVTTYVREELLYLCLEAIRREDYHIPVFVFSDRGADSPELSVTCSVFRAELIIRPAHSRYGNSWNTITACEWAVSSIWRDLGIVHLIEDDTIIHPGYFRWARQQLALDLRVSPFQITHGDLRFRYAAVCGRIASPHIPNWYESPCASWNAGHMTVALKHVIPEYLADTREEMQIVLDERIFPGSQWKKGGAEQDGFFLRCIEHGGWKTKFPPIPLATHLGWWGYNSPPLRPKPAGSFNDRIEACRAMFANVAQRKEWFGHRITDAELSGNGGF
jgi:hypothetical protein